MMDTRTIFERHFGALLVMIRSGRGGASALRLASEIAAQAAGSEPVTVEAGVLHSAGLDEPVNVSTRLVARGFDALHIMPGITAEELLATATALASDELPVRETAHVGFRPLLMLSQPNALLAAASTPATPATAGAPVREVPDRRAVSERRRLLGRRYVGVNRRRNRERRQTGERRVALLQQQRLMVERHAQLLAEASEAGAWLEALHAAHALILLEPQIPAARRGMHRIAVQRMLPAATLHKFAALGVTREEEREAAARVLRWMGMDGAAALLPLIMQSEFVESRRFLHEAFVTIPDVHTLLAPRLSSERWFEVRHAAELLGLMRAPGYLPQLRKLFEHPNDQVRLAAVNAIAEYSADEAAVPLGAALASPSIVLRDAAVAAIHRKRVPGFAMPLLAALHRETRSAQRLEVVRTLGVLAQPDAALALSRIALTKKPMLGSGGYNQDERLEAVAALRASPAPNARQILARVARDADGRVRAQARQALDALDTPV